MGHPCADACRLKEMEEEIKRLNDLLIEIGDYAHEHSTGPTVPDAMWTVRRMAYQE